MVTTIGISNVTWVNGVVSFTVNYSTNLYAENKILEWSVGGAVKGSMTGGVNGGGGTTQFNYSSSSDSFVLTIKLYQNIGGSKGAYIPAENENFTITKTTVPNAPNLASQVINLNQILITWNKDPNVTSYNLELTTPSNSNFVSFGGDFTANSYDSTQYGIYYNASSDGTYSFRIRAKNSLGYSSYSNVTTITKNTQTVNVGVWSCKFPDGYQNNIALSLLEKSNAESWGMIALSQLQAPNTSTISDVSKFSEPFHGVYFTVKKTTSVPVTPVLTVASIDKYNFLLSWTGLTTDQFNLERATSTQNYSSVFGDLQDTDNQVQVSIPQITETYYYRLRTKNSVGYSSYSNVITVENTEATPEPEPEPELPPNAPFITSQNYNQISNQILVSWNPVNNAIQYNLEVSTPLFPNFNSLGGDSSNWETINGKLAFIYNLSEYGTYQFRLRSKNNAGYSGYSNIETVTYEEVIPPDDPATQTVIQIQTPNNNNDIRGVLNPTNLQKWITDNENSQLCNYPQFTGLNVPCSLTWFNTGAMVSEPDNFQSVIQQIALRYGGTGTAPKSTIMQKMIGGLSLAFALSLLGSKR